MERAHGLTRTVYRQDGRIVADWVEQQCQGTGATRFCTPPWPYIPYQQLPGVALAAEVRAFTARRHRAPSADTASSGSNRCTSPPGQQAFPRWRPGRLRRGHAPAARAADDRARAGASRDGRSVTTRSRSCPTSRRSNISFVVPDGGAAATRRALRPSSRATDSARGLGQRSASTPLWLGRSFQGHRLPLGRGRARRGVAHERARANAAAGALRTFRLRQLLGERVRRRTDRRGTSRTRRPGRSCSRTRRIAFARDGMLVSIDGCRAEVPARPGDGARAGQGAAAGRRLALGRAQHRELIRDLEPARAEAVERRRASARCGRARGARPVGSSTPRRSSTRCRFVAETACPSAATYSSRSSEIVNTGGASANAMFVYESFARSRSRPASTIARWS